MQLCGENVRAVGLTPFETVLRNYIKVSGQIQFYWKQQQLRNWQNKTPLSYIFSTIPQYSDKQTEHSKVTYILALKNISLKGISVNVVAKQ